MNRKWLVCLFLLVAMVGVVSADTALFYTTNTSDGHIYGEGFNLSWSDIWSGTHVHADSTAIYMSSRLYSGVATNTYDDLWRIAIIFNSSTLPDDAVITSTNVGLYGYSHDHDLVDSSLNIVKFNIDGTISTDDYDNFDTVLLSDNISASVISVDAYNNWSLNSLGISNISKTGNSGFGVRFSYDWLNTPPTWTGSHRYTGARFRTAEYVLYPPFLEVTYSTAVTPVASFTTTKNFIRIPGILQVNDTSTNAPSYWNWSWGDGTWTNGTTASEQNATHQYSKRGIWSVYLLAGSIDGDNTSASQTVRVVGYENYW